MWAFPFGPLSTFPVPTKKDFSLESASANSETEIHAATACKEGRIDSVAEQRCQRGFYICFKIHVFTPIF